MKHSRRWWRQWNSGAYDRVLVIRKALLDRLKEAAHECPYYFADDYVDLRDTGRIPIPAISTQDILVSVCHDYRLMGRQIDVLKKQLFGSP